MLENAKAKREGNKLKKASEIKKEKKEKKKESKSAADRRDELLKQLKAVENAIAKKRTKIHDSQKWNNFWINVVLLKSVSWFQ